MARLKELDRVKKNTIAAAKDLFYPEEAVAEIRNALNEQEISSIMKHYRFITSNS